MKQILNFIFSSKCINSVLSYINVVILNLHIYALCYFMFHSDHKIHINFKSQHIIFNCIDNKLNIQVNKFGAIDLTLVLNNEIQSYYS